MAPKIKRDCDILTQSPEPLLPPALTTVNRVGPLDELTDWLLASNAIRRGNLVFRVVCESRPTKKVGSIPRSSLDFECIDSTLSKVSAWKFDFWEIASIYRWLFIAWKSVWATVIESMGLQHGRLGNDDSRRFYRLEVTRAHTRSHTRSRFKYVFDDTECQPRSGLNRTKICKQRIRMVWAVQFLSLFTLEVWLSK